MLPILLFALAVAGCRSMPSLAPSSGVAQAPAAPARLLQGRFDNHEQVWTARSDPASIASPHLKLDLEPTPVAGWTTWRLHLDSTPPIEAIWASRMETGSAAATLLMHRALVAQPGFGAAFDPAQWTPLDACALRGSITPEVIRVAADEAACNLLAPGIGASAALLPLRVEREGEWLRVRLYADQARGMEAREDLRLVQTFGGWAAIHGGGPSAQAQSRDWHMNSDLRLGNEGGRASLTWRDGGASGYSLLLERISYRDGKLPVLKLSVVEDANGHTHAYAWANPEATQIGINLGWLQVGLQREGETPVSARSR